MERSANGRLDDYKTEIQVDKGHIWNDLNDLCERSLAYLELEDILDTVEFLLESVTLQALVRMQVLAVCLFFSAIDPDSRRQGDYGQPDRAPAVVVQGSLSARRGLNGSLVGLAYLAENSSYVSSSWWPPRRLEVVLKAGRLIARATGVCRRDRGNWGALKRLAGRTARVATRKTETGDIVRGVGMETRAN